jgi:hypothetical protein
MLELSLEGKSPNENDLLLGYTVHMLKSSTIIVENLGYSGAGISTITERFSTITQLRAQDFCVSLLFQKIDSNDTIDYLTCPLSSSIFPCQTMMSLPNKSRPHLRDP